MSKNLLIVGPVIIDSKSSGGEGEKLYQVFKNEAYNVAKVSRFRNRFVRMLDTIFYLIWNNRKYDLVVLMVFSGRAFVLETISLIIGKLFRKKVIAVLHGGAFQDFYESNERWCNKVFNNCDVIATPSKMIQKYLTERSFNIVYLPNFIDERKFNITKRSVTANKLLWVRAFDDIYHPELIIEAMRILKEKNPKIHLTMIGPDKGLLKKCKDLISNYDLEGNIEILGFVPNDDLPAYYRNHNVFVNTTRFESFGVCLVEAASCGLPIVSVCVGEIPFVWEHNKNIKLTERNPIAFASEIFELLENKMLSETISRNASLLVEQYTWENVSFKWSDIIER